MMAKLSSSWASNVIVGQIDVPAQPTQALVGCVPSLNQILRKRQVRDPWLAWAGAIQLGFHQLLLALVEPSSRNAIDEQATEVQVFPLAKPPVKLDRFIDSQGARAP